MGGHGKYPPIPPLPAPLKKVGGKYNREIYQEAKELYNKGYSVTRISRDFGILISTLQHWLRYGMGEHIYLN